MAFFINHTKKEIVETDTQSVLSIASYLLSTINENPSWSMNDEIEVLVDSEKILDFFYIQSLVVKDYKVNDRMSVLYKSRTY